MFLLVPAYPRTPGPKAVKRLSVCVAVYSHSLRIRDQEIYNSNQIRNFQLTFKLRDQLTSLEETKEAEHYNNHACRCKLLLLRRRNAVTTHYAVMPSLQWFAVCQSHA